MRNKDSIGYADGEEELHKESGEMLNQTEDSQPLLTTCEVCGGVYNKNLEECQGECDCHKNFERGH